MMIIQPYDDFLIFYGHSRKTAISTKLGRSCKCIAKEDPLRLGIASTCESLFYESISRDFYRDVMTLEFFILFSSSTFPLRLLLNHVENLHGHSIRLTYHQKHKCSVPEKGVNQKTLRHEAILEDSRD